jgi:hypothetical protein
MQALLTYGFVFISGNGGLSAWQMTYLFEGLMGVVLCIFLWFFFVSPFSSTPRVLMT